LFSQAAQIWSVDSPENLFALWCSDARNSIILTSRSGQGTLGQRLHDQRNLKSVTLELKQLVKLEGKLICFCGRKKQNKSNLELH
jgi:Cft2 family RNA processing exonuclease